MFWSCFGPSACKLLGTGQDPVLVNLVLPKLGEGLLAGVRWKQTLRIVPRRMGRGELS